MSTFKRAIIHIGTEKTGTSSIQLFLRDNQEILAREGFYYPRAIANASGSQWEYVAAVHPSPWGIDAGRAFGIKNEEDSQQFAEKLQAVLSDELASIRTADTLLVSSEHLYCRLHNKDSIRRLKNLLEPYVDEFKILTYFRRQDRVAVSLLSTRVKSGTKHLGGVLPQPDEYQFQNFDYFKKYQRWASVFGEDAMQSRLYEDAAKNEHAIISDFCDSTGIQLAGKRIPKQLNPSLSKQGVYFLRALNQVMPKSRDGKIDYERASLVQDIAELYKGKHIPINAKDAKEFYAQFRGGNEQLRKRAFPEKEKPLFDDDFSEYPQKADNAAPTYKEAVEVAVALWRQARYKNTPAGFMERARQYFRRRR